MAYFTSLWKARIIDKCKREYEDEKINSILASNTEIPRKSTSMMQKWRIYRRDTRTRLTGKLKKVFPEGSSVSNLYYYLKTDQTFPNFVLKSVVGFLGGIVLTYLCFMFFVFQLSISLLHATIMSSVIGVLLTLGLAFSYRIRCLVFLLIPQLFSRVGRYTLTCYALVLILTGPATNTFKNSEVLSESMACSQEQIKTSVGQINESMRKPFNAMKDTVKLMVETIKRLTSTLDKIISRISVLVISISDVIQSSLSWLNSVGDACNKKFGTPYDYCMKAVNRGVLNCKKTFKDDSAWLCSASLAAKSACWTAVRPYKSVCFIADYATTSFAATMKRKLRVFTDRITRMFFIQFETQHTYTFTSNASDSASQVAAGIVTELRNRADPLLTWLSWSSCVTSLFLLLIIFRAKYYQHMFETRSRFDNRYVTQELRELDLKRYREGRETILPLNRREKAKYINVTSFRLVTSEKLHLTRSMVFMTITTFKLLIHIVADYSLYWVLMTIRYHGRFQTILPPGPSDAGVHISGYGIVADFIRSIFDALTIPLVQKLPSPVTCLPNPYPPDLQRYTQIAVLIMLLWFFALFEPYGLRLRHVIMGHYRPERAKTRAVWLYNHILRTRGSFMKLARRKLHREYKYSDQEHLTFRHWINSLLPCWCLRCMFGTLPMEPHCLLCDTMEERNDSDTKLINCKTTKCPGVYCTRCFCDIGHLCTICLSPEDYGDMSDLSLEKGSSDDSSDQQCEDDGDHNNDALAFQRKNLHDDERERLIKRSDTNTKRKRKKASKEHNNQAEDEISLISSDDEPQHKIVNSRFTKYLIKYKTNTLLLSLIKNKTNIVFKEHTDLNNNSYFKVQKNMQKYIDLYNFEKYTKAHDDKRQKVYSIENCYKFRKRCRNKLKRNVKNNKWHHIFRILSNKLRFRHLKIFKCFGLRCDCINSFNNYHIKSTNRSFQVFKINAHSRKLKKIKRGYYKPSNQKKQNIINYMTTSNIQKIFLTSSKYRTSKNKDQKSKNKRDIDLNALSNNIESRKNKKEKDSKDANICKKHNEIAKNKHSSNGVQKLCSFCSCFHCKGSPSREIVEGSECCCLKHKTNFKRRKKAAKDKSELISNKNRMAKEENINDRNYRLSSYLSDQSWLWQKLCKDSEKERMKKMNVLCDLAELRIAVTDQQTKEARLLKVIKKAFKKTTHKCRCPSNVCVCELQPSNNKKLNKNRDIINKTSFDSKKYYCKYLSSKKSASKAKKTDYRSPKYVDQDSITEQCAATESADAQLARRLNFYTSLGNHDFEAIGDIPQAGTTCSKENNNTSSETTVPSNIASSSKTKSSKHSYSQRFDLDWLTTNIKLIKIKDIKLAISERFLHLRMKNPLPMMRDIYSTLIEASSKNKKETKYEENCMNKETDEKGVTVLPIVKTCSCQHIDVPTAHEDRTTQIDKKHNKNTKPIMHKHLRDAEVEVVAQTCTCATQYTKSKHKTCSCKKEDKDIKVEFGDTANIEDYFSDETESNVTLSTISLAEDTKTDTTVCSRVTIDYEVSPSRAKPKKNVRKVKVDVITKANQGTSTDRTKQCDVSTITSDWWSPIVEKKFGKVHLGRGEMYERRRPRKKSYRDRSVCTDGRIVTFMSRAQIIPTETGDILSPSRYLLESQKYYNELFSSRFYSPRVYPVKIKGTKDCEKQWSSRESNRKGRKTKRLNRKNSPRLKEETKQNLLLSSSSIVLPVALGKNGVLSKGAIRSFPKSFLFGVSTAAYQIEGGSFEDGKGLSIWDIVTHIKPSLVDDGSTGDTAADSYHLYKRDVAMIKDLGVDFYRFSIAWTRILPNGFSNNVNQAGLNYYDNLIDALLQNDITPFVTIYHWDLPHDLQRLGGWMNPAIVDWFVDYAKVLFDNFGDRVKLWITINEPKEICHEGYGSDIKAPLLNMTGIAEYICAKNVLLAHAKAYRLYDEEYRKIQGGSIGISISGVWFEPASDVIDDHQAALDARQFDWGLYAHPIFSKEGDYPAEVKNNVNNKSAEQAYARSRLPELSASEVTLIRGTSDFFGLNSYTTKLAYRDASLEGMFPVPSYRDDVGAVLAEDPSWPRSQSSWLHEVPWGFHKLLLEINKLYDNPPVYVTGNGWSSQRGLLDEDRIRYMRSHLIALLDAVKDGCNVKLYAVWSLMDNFEWLRGYTEKFGLYEVDFSSPDKTTTPRKSAFIYKEIVRSKKLDPNYEPEQYFEEREAYSKNSQEQERGKTADADGY